MARKTARDSKFRRLVNGDLEVENAVIKWTNFAGKPTDFNPAGGKRTFVLELSEEIAEELRDEGWNVKFKEPREEGDEPIFYTEIVVNMNSKYPPKVVLLSEFRGRKKSNRLEGDMVGTLDDVRYENVDVIIHPFNHGRPGLYSVKGYARAIYVTQAQDVYFDGKYADWENDYNDEAF